MIDLSQSPKASPLVHTVASDPGMMWSKDAVAAIEAPPDEDVAPRPEARWPPKAVRTGICGAVSPRVLAMPGGGFRMYYSQILPRPGFPAGANDYDNSTTRILSAFSWDGRLWTPETGVRLSARAGGAGEFRVVSSEVVPVADGSRLRMYYECCAGPQTTSNSIRSAISSDGGLEWTAEPGARLETAGCNYSAPRLVFLSDGRCRLYAVQRGLGIVSAVSADGLRFDMESGVRIAQNGPYDSCAAFAPEILWVGGSGYVMYYAAYSSPNRAYILRAESDDGLIWHKASQPVISPGPGGHDAAKCSEMCVIRLPQVEGVPPRYRMFYEACDGTAPNERGVWRIASATSVEKQPRWLCRQPATADNGRMRFRLSTKISVAILGVLLLALLSSGIALLAAWRAASAMESVVVQNLASVREAEELEIALLEQRGFVSSHILDGGNRKWLDELDDRESAFRHWLSQARATAHTADERAVLSDLDEAYTRYEIQRREVIALFEAGETERARTLFLNDVDDLYHAAYESCETFLAANEHYVETTAAQAHYDVRRAALLVGISAVATLCLGGSLLWLFLRGVIAPLRAMAADARLLADGHVQHASPALANDELHEVGLYLRTLMSDVRDARARIDQHRVRLEQAERLASVGKLAASVAHEIRNPLTSMKMWLFSVRKSVASDAGLSRKLDVVSGEILRLEAIVENFLEFSRPPTLQLERLSVDQVIRNTLELFAQRAGDARLTLVHADAACLPADADQLRQVLLNLLGNAADVLWPGGTIWIASACERVDGADLMLVIRVEDSGPGIPDEIAAHIFEPFFTTKDEGTGLGLCVAARIMALHGGGRMALEPPRHGSGACFALWIPVAPEYAP